ncbi:hypothetical protein GCM10009603_49920 [Nocardiopsis exhalans]
MLAGDDAKSSKWKVSAAAWAPLLVAVDHLHCLRSSLVSGEKPPNLHLTIHQGAQFSLVRNALENAARSMWVLSPSLRLKRIEHNLSLQRKEYGDSGTLRSELGMEGKQWAVKRQADIDTEARRIGIPEFDPVTNKRVNLMPAGYGEMVRSAGEWAGIGGNSAKAIWHLCSALAHGDTQGTLSGLETNVLETVDGVCIAQVTGSIPNLLSFTQAATIVLDKAFELYRLRATRLI